MPSDSTTTFYATATDTFGTVSGCSATSVTYVEDSTAPNAPTIGTSPTSPASGRSPSWSFTAELGATIECRLTSGSGGTLSDWAACTSPKSYSLTGQADGSYVLDVRATDAAGNTEPGVDVDIHARHLRSGRAVDRHAAGIAVDQPLAVVGVHRRGRARRSSAR